MSTFDLQMNGYQVKWRKSNVKTREWGWQRGSNVRGYYPESWKEGLWPGIREGAQNPLVKYLEESGMRQQAARTTSKAPGRYALTCTSRSGVGASRDGRALLASFLRQHVAGEIASLECIGWNTKGAGSCRTCSASVTGRAGRETSPDLGLMVNNGCGLAWLRTSSLLRLSRFQAQSRSIPVRTSERGRECAFRALPCRAGVGEEVLGPPSPYSRHECLGRSYPVSGCQGPVSALPPACARRRHSPIGSARTRRVGSSA